MQHSSSIAIATRTAQHEVWWKLAQRKIGPGEVVQRCGLTDGWTDNDQGVITIAHPATAVQELKRPPFTEAFPWEMVPPPPNPSPWNASVKVVFFFLPVSLKIIGHVPLFLKWFLIFLCSFSPKLVLFSCSLKLFAIVPLFPNGHVPLFPNGHVPLFPKLVGRPLHFFHYKPMENLICHSDKSIRT